MMDRCYNENSHTYRRYGAVGIKVCDRWHDLKNFVKDMGTKDRGLTIDRINNSLGYFKSNCRWANYTVQSRNRSYVKLSMTKARDIRLMKIQGFKRKDMAIRYNVSIATVKKVLSNTYWKEHTSFEKTAPAIAKVFNK